MSSKGTTKDLILSNFKDINLTGTELINFAEELEKKLIERKKLSTTL